MPTRYFTPSGLNVIFRLFSIIIPSLRDFCGRQPATSFSLRPPRPLRWAVAFLCVLCVLCGDWFIAPQRKTLFCLFVPAKLIGYPATFLRTQGHGHRVPTLKFLYMNLTPFGRSLSCNCKAVLPFFQPQRGGLFVAFYAN